MTVKPCKYGPVSTRPVGELTIKSARSNDQHHPITITAYVAVEHSERPQLKCKCGNDDSFTYRGFVSITQYDDQAGELRMFVDNDAIETDSSVNVKCRCCGTEADYKTFEDCARGVRIASNRWK